MAEKRIVWIGSSLDDVRAFSPEPRRLAGYQLHRLQNGMTPNDWKPVKTVGPGVNEIRIHSVVEHRILYVVRFPETIYVLHAFQKRTRQTRQADIELAKSRLAELIRLHSKTKER
jgi:phage-related protein